MKKMLGGERRPRGETSRADTRLALEAFQRALETADLDGPGLTALK